MDDKGLSNPGGLDRGIPCRNNDLDGLATTDTSIAKTNLRTKIRLMNMRINKTALCLIGCSLLPEGQVLADTAKSTPANQQHVARTAAANLDKNKISYGIGVDMGRNFKRLALDIDLALLAKGIKDAYEGQPLSVPDNELRQTMSAYQNQLKDKQSAAIKQAAETNLAAGEAFLTANAKKDGVVASPSGLQYKVLKAGTGKQPTDANSVVCNYRGTLLDGTEFDSSARVGKPVQFNVNEIIPGWQEALKLMPEGSKWQLFIPAQLAYGLRGAGRDIGPNATLIFELELLRVEAAKIKAATPQIKM